MKLGPRKLPSNIHDESLSDFDGKQERDYKGNYNKERRQARRAAHEASCRKQTLALSYCPSESNLESSLILNQVEEHMASIAEDDKRWGEGYHSRGSTISGHWKEVPNRGWSIKREKEELEYSSILEI